MEDDPNRIYYLDGVVHIAGNVHEEFHCCISSMRRQHDMPLDDRIKSRLAWPSFASLNDHWFKLDKPLVSAFVERWSSKTHTFHLSFGECTITLQDVAYQLGHPISSQ
ncbi:hypothetical protein Ahy_A10g051353 [Arachis hypogaea]|uniref:Aminotransferase-like plant mobile domain-containing protein n=1 Tax=Arachis hypogaea TaxID=3818 RepID=A0A445BCH4_ARAHY|nr:hypothetical protein Ahy_A10g051353 [Arachis hypogaea]